MSALRKTLVYLGLAEDVYDDDAAPGRTGDGGHGRDAASASNGAHDERLDRAVERAEHRGDHRADHRGDADARSTHDRAGGRGMDRLMDARHQPDRGTDRGDRGDGRRATVTALPHVVGAHGPVQRITAVHPRSYNDAKIIGEHFRDGIPVIMNLTDMSDGDAKRLVDFAAGLVFGLQGVVERVTTKVFLLSPATVEVLNEADAPPAPVPGFFDQA